jgi:hypothetical protein
MLQHLRDLQQLSTKRMPYLQAFLDSCHRLLQLQQRILERRTNCVSCHNTCAQCVNGNLFNQCTQCKSNGQLTANNTCRCNDGYYQDALSGNCNSCHMTCSTCTAGLSTDCSACKANASKNLLGLCVCNTGYFADGTEAALCAIKPVDHAQLPSTQIARSASSWYPSTSRHVHLRHRQVHGHPWKLCFLPHQLQVLHGSKLEPVPHLRQLSHLRHQPVFLPRWNNHGTHRSLLDLPLSPA